MGSNRQEEHADVLVLGAGSGGYSCALRAAQLGLSVTLVDRAELGGTCLHVGCIPTKALLHAAEVAETVRRSARFGVTATLDGIDIAAVHAYKDRVVDRLHRGLSALVDARGITVVKGTGTFVGPRSVEVDGHVLTGRNVVLATGSYTRTLPGLEFDGQRVIGSEDALELDRIPSSAVVLGGGVIGCEFASLWRSIGVEVTIIEAQDRLLPGEDDATSKAVERAFRQRGMTVLTGTSFVDAELLEGGVLVHASDRDPIKAELALVAVGRGPNTDGLGLEDHGISLDRGFVTTDERLRTSAEGVYAVGDIVPGPQLAHRGFAHGIFVAETIANLEPVPVRDDLVPRITYSDPEAASVGLSEAAAREQYGADRIESITYDLAGNGRSQILEAQGFIKLVRLVDGPILGAHAVGSRVGEVIGEAQLATAWEALPDDVAPLIHAHPTQHEAMGEAFLSLAGKPLHRHA